MCVCKVSEYSELQIIQLNIALFDVVEETTQITVNYVDTRVLL